MNGAISPPSPFITGKMSLESRVVHHEEWETARPQRWLSAGRLLSVHWQRLPLRTRLLWISVGLFVIIQACGKIASSIFPDAPLDGLSLFFLVSGLGGMFVGSHLVSSESTSIVRHRHLLSWTTPFAMRVPNSYKPPRQGSDDQMDHHNNLSGGVSPVAEEVYKYINLIMQDFIHSWYDDLISDNGNFPADILTLMREASTQIVLRLSRLKRVPLLQNLVGEFQKHLTIMEKSKNSLKKLKRTSRSQESHDLVACYETFSILHPAAMSKDLELDYIRSVFGMVVDCVLPTNVKACEAGVLLVREIVCQAVIVEAVDLISDPDFINRAILLLALHAQSPPSMSQNQSSQSQMEGEEVRVSQHGIGQLHGVEEEEEEESCQHLGSQSHTMGEGDGSQQRQQREVDGVLKSSRDLLEINHNIILGGTAPNCHISRETGQDLDDDAKITSAAHGAAALSNITIFQGPECPNCFSTDSPSPCHSDGTLGTPNGECGKVPSHTSEENTRNAVSIGNKCPGKSVHTDSLSRDNSPSNIIRDVMVEPGTVVAEHDGRLVSDMADTLSEMVESCAEATKKDVHPGKETVQHGELESNAADPLDDGDEATGASTKITHPGFSPRHRKSFPFTGFSLFVPVPLKRRSTSPALSSLSRSVDSMVDSDASPGELVAESCRRCRNKSVPDVFADSGDDEVEPGPAVLEYQGLGDVDGLGEDEVDAVPAAAASAGGDEVTEEQRFICNLSITSTEQVQEHNTKKMYVLYVIEFEIQASEDETDQDPSTKVELQVRRRYREFLTLHWKLEHQPEFRRSLRGVKNFPKRFALPIMKRDVSGIKQRRAMLEKYLKQLLNIPKIHTSQEIVDFLALNGNAHIAFVRKTSSHTPNFDKILRSSLSGVKQGLKNLAPFPSSRSEMKLEKMEAAAPPSNGGEEGSEDLRQFEVLRVCSLKPNDSKFGLIDIMPYVIDDALLQSNHLHSEAQSRATTEDRPSVVDSHESTAGQLIRREEEEPDLWLYSCIMDTVSILQKQPDHWVFEENTQLLLRNLCGDLVQRFVQREIWTLLTPKSWALYLSLIRDEIWPDGVLFQGSGGVLSLSEKDELSKKAEDILFNSYPSVLNILAGKKQLHDGISELFKSVQNQHLNKHLIYTFLDHLLDQALPVLKVKTGEMGY